MLSREDSPAPAVATGEPDVPSEDATRAEAPCGRAHEGPCGFEPHIAADHLRGARIHRAPNLVGPGRARPARRLQPAGRSSDPEGPSL